MTRQLPSSGAVIELASWFAGLKRGFMNDI